MPRVAEGRESTKGYSRHPHPSGIVPHPCLSLPGDADSSSACFPSRERAQEEASLLTLFTSEVPRAITSRICCQDLQKAGKLKQEIEQGSRRHVSLFAGRKSSAARLSLSELGSLLGAGTFFLHSAHLLQKSLPLQHTSTGQVAFRSSELYIHVGSQRHPPHIHKYAQAVLLTIRDYF